MRCTLASPGPRCERHVGEPYPPCCADCDAVQPVQHERPPAVGVYSSTECCQHPGYYEPCDACWRADRTAAAN